jgi:cytochrome c oxidase subunit 3
MSYFTANANDINNHDHHGDAPHEHHYDPEGDKMGMWLFLFTELLLFGIFFIGFAVYLNMYPEDFSNCSKKLNPILGGINTLVLLISSFTMALAIQQLQKGNKMASQILSFLTLICAGVFCLIKSFEWTHKFDIGLFLNSEHLATLPHGEQIFYGLYFVMTGTHAIHVIIGAILIITTMVFVHFDKVHAGRITLIENAGLFWHLVDLIWIFLFPLYYLIG